MTPEMNQKAIEIIVNKINSIEENKLMEKHTAGGLQGLTEREGEAYGMALYFVQKITGIKFDGKLYENYTAEQIEADKMVKEIASAAIAITGK